MSNPIIGAVSLTDRTGVFLGSVNINNLDASANQLLYTPDGAGISGLTIDAGLQKDGTTLKTIGNPEIQLVAHSLYVNDNIQSPSSVISEANEGDVIYLSAGSYGETLDIPSKYDIGVQAPQVGNTICQVLGGLTITGTSELVRITNLQIQGSTSTIAGVGRTVLNRCVFNGSNENPQTITIGDGSTKYFTFENCEFDNYTTIVVSDTFASVIYFINCNFEGATITLNNSSALQVIMNNCAGLVSYPSNATLIGLNVLTSGQSQVNTYDLKTTLINGASYITIADQAEGNIPFCSATTNQLGSDTRFSYDADTNTLNLTNPFHINIDGAQPPSNMALCSNGAGGGMKYVPILDQAFRYVADFSGQQTTSASAGSVTLFDTGADVYNYVPPYKTYIDCIFNFHITGGNDVMTISLYDNVNSVVAQTFTFQVGAGVNTIPVKFNYTFPFDYKVNFKINASIVTQIIEYTPDDYYSVLIQQLVVP